jgi:hypothetical protein
MDFKANMQNWLDCVKDYNPSLAKEINKIRSLYTKALDKQGKGLTCMEHFAVIAVHAPELTTRKKEEFVACRCTVEWTGEDYHITPITTITRKKKKTKFEPVVKKKTKKVRKKKKRTIDI